MHRRLRPALVASALSLLSLLALAATPQQGRARPDARQLGVVERLELGMSALAELGYESEHQHLAEILRRVRIDPSRGHDRAPETDRPQREESDEVREVRRRLRLMRFAVELMVKVGDEPVAHGIEHAMHARELAIERRDDPEARRVRESAPDRAQLAEMLAHASRVAGEHGNRELSVSLRELSDLYLEQWRRRQRATGTEREPARASSRLEDLAVRLEVLRRARRTHTEAGHVDAADLLERVLHVGELQQAGAPDEQIVSAFQGLEIGAVIELLQGAAELQRHQGQVSRSETSAALAEFYAARERGREQEQEQGREQGQGQRDAQIRWDLEAVQRERGDQRLEQLTRQLTELEDQLALLRAQLAELRGDR